MDEVERELLVELALEDGSRLEFYRDSNKDVSLCRKDHCVVIPRASGRNTIELFAILEDLGVTIFPDVDAMLEEANAGNGTGQTMLPE